MKVTHLRILILIGLGLGTIECISSFWVFYENMDTLGTPQEWKFFFSLAGFLIFFGMLLLLIIVLIFRWWLITFMGVKSKD